MKQNKFKITSYIIASLILISNILASPHMISYIKYSFSSFSIIGVIASVGYLLNIAGTIEIIRSKSWGYYFVYTAYILNFLGCTICYIPFINYLVPIEFLLHAIIGVNLLFILMLGYSQYKLKQKNA